MPKSPTAQLREAYNKKTGWTRISENTPET